MKRVKLKRTDLQVSRLCFGTMTFGKPVDQAKATKMVDRCIDEGIISGRLGDRSVLTLPSSSVRTPHAGGYDRSN